MKIKNPKYVTRDKGPDGVERFYYRRPGQLKIRIDGIPWTPEFMAVYNKIRDGKFKQKPKEYPFPKFDDGNSKVYFIYDNVAIKIGRSIKPTKRRSGLQTSHHQRLTILGTMDGDAKIEKQTQNLFASDWLRGEWYKDTRRLRKFIVDNCEQFTPPPDQHTRRESAKPLVFH